MTILRRNFLNPNFDDLITRDWFNLNSNRFSSTKSSIPSVNIIETKDDFLVEMAAPGLRKEDFHVELHNNLLTMKCERQHEIQEDDQYVLREFSYQSFQRSFELSKDAVDMDKINATYEDGMLRLTIPKTEAAKPVPPRMIEIA